MEELLLNGLGSECLWGVEAGIIASGANTGRDKSELLCGKNISILLKYNYSLF